MNTQSADSIVGSLVEIKGAVQTDGSINATKIEIKNGSGSPVNSNKLYGKIETLPNNANFIGAWVVAGKTINVTVYTRIQRKHGLIAVGTYVEVSGLTQTDGSINATEIEVEQGQGNGAFMSFNPVTTVEAASYQEEATPDSIVAAFGENMAAARCRLQRFPYRKSWEIQPFW